MSGMSAWRIGQYVEALAGAGRAPGTLRLRAYHLRRFSREHPSPDNVTAGDVARWLAGRQPETAKSWRASLHGYYLWAIRGGWTREDPTAALLPIRVPRAIPKPCPPAVARIAIMHADPETALMIELGCWAGLRRAEIANLHSDDLIGARLRICGKGGHVRIVPISAKSAAAIAARGPGYVFPGRWPGQPMRPDTVGKRIKRALGPGWTAHTLRHGFATAAYRSGHDLRAVQELLGHASPATTARYVAVDDDAARAAAAAAWAAYGGGGDDG